MRAGVTFQIAVALAGLTPLPVRAASELPRFNVPPARLSDALSTLARQAGIEILFSDSVVGDRASPALLGRMRVDAALETLLVGSGLTYRRTSEGTFIVSLSTTAARLAPPTPAVAEAIPEILVVARRAQNGDIRRTQDDIQPYQVFTGREIEDSYPGSIDNFARTRLTANAQDAAPAQIQQRGQATTRSEINLRGLGANQTLLLVDGRRLPGVPQTLDDSLQPDINGIPIELIDRIEVLTATGGGIYGSGANSGVLNVVLRHDYDGGQVALTTGLTTRGDSFEERVFGRFGFSPDHGRTGIMVAVGQSRADTPRFGERSYARRARTRALANSPEELLASYPAGKAINIFGSADLVLDDGTALGSGRTFLPAGFGGDPTLRDRLLQDNAGATDLRTSEFDARDTITSRPEIRSIFADVRHEFGGGFAAYANLLSYRNTARSTYGSQTISFFTLIADNPINPFQQDINVAAPLPGTGAETTNRITTTRYTVGFVAPLPAGWTANLEYNGGEGRSRYASRTVLGTGDLFDAVDQVPVPGRPALNPLGDWASYLAAAAAYTSVTTSVAPRKNRFDDATLRLGGPLATLPGGMLTLTLLGEARREVTPRSTAVSDLGDFVITSPYPRREQSVVSLYGETRLPLVGNHGPFSGLEFQLAVRQDWVRIVQPALPLSESLAVRSVTRTGAPAVTAGARFSPLTGLLLRASFGSGSLPPAPSQFTRVQFTGGDFRGDPQRGGQQIGSERDVTFVFGGNPDLGSERARSFLLGFVLAPSGERGARLSLDYTRIVKRGEIQLFPNADVDALLAAEALYPSRVIRAPLSATDRARGFSAGPITKLDFGLLNLGRTRIDALDLTADMPFELVRLGSFTAYLKATWQPHYQQRNVVGGPIVERVGYLDGPLTLRGNAGLSWSSGAWSANANVQVYGRYKVTRAADTFENAQLLRYNGKRVPAQAYLDLGGRYRFAGTGFVPQGTEIRVGIVNVLDHRPPTVVGLGLAGVSYYGDARRQRVEATLAVPIGASSDSD